MLLIEMVCAGILGYWAIQALIAFGEWNESRKHLNARRSKVNALQLHQ